MSGEANADPGRRVHQTSARDQCQEASQSGCCCALACLFHTAARWFGLTKTIRAIRNAAAAATPPMSMV